MLIYMSGFVCLFSELINGVALRDKDGNKVTDSKVSGLNRYMYTAHLWKTPLVKFVSFPKSILLP